MARTDYGAILSTVIKDTSDAVREVNGTSNLIAPNQWGTAIRTMHSDSDYENALEQMIEETATGDIASFSDGANDIPLKSLTCAINPVQSGSGDPSPSNVRPITGHTELNLAHTGKNLFTYSTSFYNGYWTGTAENPVFTGDNSAKTLDEATGWKYVKIPVNSGTQVTISGMIADGGTFSAFLGSDNVLDVVSYFTSINNNGTKTVPSGAKYMCLSLYNAKGQHGSFPNAQVEVGSSATTYEAYTGTTTTTTFGTTVYGGTLDVVSGVLTIDRAYVTLTSSQNWTYSSGWSDSTTSVFYDVDVNTNIKYPNYDYQSIVLCDKLIPSTRNEVSNKDGKERLGVSGAVTQPSLTVRILSSRASTTQQFKDWLDSNPVHGVYELATPTTTQLTPQEVKSLLGSNNFYHDCNGQVAVTYKANGQLYVEQHT